MDLDYAFPKGVIGARVSDSDSNAQHHVIDNGHCKISALTAVACGQYGNSFEGQSGSASDEDETGADESNTDYSNSEGGDSESTFGSDRYVARPGCRSSVVRLIIS